MIKKNIMILFVLIVFFEARAQDLHEAPSLQVGLSGIKFSKGNLDPELVAEIIAEKQKEVKVKLIKNMLLNNLGVDNGLFYAYIDHSIEILTTEKNEDTRVKNLLENTVNLSFVVGYAEYYVQTLRKNSIEWNSFRELALSYGIDSSLFNKSRLSLKDFAKISFRRKQYKDIDLENIKEKFDEQRNQFVGIIIDLFAEQIRQNEQLKSLGILRTNYLQNYLTLNSYMELENESVNKNLAPHLDTLVKLLNDTKYSFERTKIEEIRKELEKNKSLTLDSISLAKLTIYKEDLKNRLSQIYKIIDKYKDELELIGYSVNENYRFITQGSGDFNNYMLHNFKINPDEILKTKDAKLIEQYSLVQWYFDSKLKLNLFQNTFNKRNIADTIFSQVGNNLNTYLKYFGLVKSLISKGNDWEKTIKTISNNFSCGDPKVLTDSLFKQYKRAKNEIIDITKLTSEEIADFKNINTFIDKLRFVELNRFEYIQTYEKEIKPSILRLSKYSLDFINLNKSVFDLLNCITTEVKDDLTKVNINLNYSFMKIFSKIDEFDKVPTYANFLNQLSDAGDFFSDEEMRKSINRIITFVRSYIKVGEDTSGRLSLNLDVEDFLYNLQKTPYNKFRPLEFHFTVGANTASFQKNLIVSSGDTIRNYSFIGEKIGIKFKLWDYKYVRSFSKGETFTYKHWYNLFRSNHVTYLRTSPPKEPTISNIHLLAYGSGILYNLLNTGTTKNFNSPIIGIGFGVTFFNDLDFNVSWGKPILINKAFNDSSVPSFFNIGFDIQFTEYFDRLNQKRKANQIQKKLAQAAKQ